MSPDTVHRIAQEIRHERAKLTCEEKWVRAQPHSSMKIESFQRINFWRDVFNDAELKIASGLISSAGVSTGS